MCFLPKLHCSMLELWISLLHLHMLWKRQPSYLRVIFIAEDKLPVALPFASTLGGNADILIHKEKDRHSSFCQKSNNK